MVSKSIAEKTRTAVLRSKKRVWTLADFKTDTPGTVLRELSRLTERGVLVRASKGIYVRPVSTPLGPSVLSKEELAKTRARRRGIDMVPTGYVGFNALGITTQISAVTELAVDKPVRANRAERSRVRFLHRDRRSLKEPKERATLDALRRINHISDTSPAEIIEAIRTTISLGNVNFDRLALLALRSEPPRVRALLGAIGDELGASADIAARLHSSLNPTTSFRIPVRGSLHNAKKWRIYD